MVDEEALLSFVIEIAQQAGQKIMAIYESGSLGTTLKSDLSPLTDADTQANDHILKSLAHLTPNIPIITEESLNDPTNNLLVSESFVWIIDPLDGTKEFIKHNDEFTVNIALIKFGQPAIGVVYAPALKQLFYATPKHGAWKKIGSQPRRALKIKPGRDKPVIVISRSHIDPATQAWLKTFGPHQLFRVGSSLKFCYLADGTADIYPRFNPIMEWDIAAGDAILRMAGGKLHQLANSEPPTYNKKNLEQPQFIAISSSIWVKRIR